MGMDDFLIFLGVLLALIGVITLGLVIAPRPYRPDPRPSQPGPPTSLRPDLPEPVRRHFVDTIGETPPQIASAVIWGRGRARIRGVWVPLRFKTWFKPEQGFHRRMSVTWYQRPVLYASDHYINGRGAREMLGRREQGRLIDSNQALLMWSEAVWLPSVLAHFPGIRWESIDAQTARMVYPMGTGEDSLLAHFDPTTGRMTHVSAFRMAEPDSEDSPAEAVAEAAEIEAAAKITGHIETEPWRVDLLEWKEFAVGDARQIIPWYISIAWGESGSPQAYWTIDGIAYNVGVEDQLI